MTESDVVIDEAAPEELLEVRRRVLRGGDPTAVVDEPRDRTQGALHLAARRDGQVVASASFYPESSPFDLSLVSCQLRFMAVDVTLQGQGIGSRILHGAETRLASRGVEEVFANARDSALGFYRTNGYEVIAGSEHLSPTTQIPHTVVRKVLRRADPFRVEWATPQDAGTLAMLRDEMQFAIRLRRDHGEWLANAERYFAETIADGSVIATVARLDDDSLAGCACASLRRNPPSPWAPVGTTAYIHSVVTAPGFRRRGVARALMVELVNGLAARGVERVTLHATDEGEPLYVDLGFEHHPRPEMRLRLS
jgi:ribosomal protein S18 acetylase RimI-like enzyme